MCTKTDHPLLRKVWIPSSGSPDPPAQDQTLWRPAVVQARGAGMPIRMIVKVSEMKRTQKCDFIYIYMTVNIVI